MARRQEIADLSTLALPGAEIAVRVTPRASRNAVLADSGQIRIHVTAPPADGAANDAVRRLLADALCIAPSRLSLIRGASSRDKVFRLE
jgi:uncharacterized protein YggU (UPF0235/DUF167 family)